VLSLLKSMLSQVVKLHVVQYGKPFGLCVDAAKTAVGNVIAYFSGQKMVQKSPLHLRAWNLPLVNKLGLALRLRLLL